MGLQADNGNISTHSYAISKRSKNLINYLKIQYDNLLFKSAAFLLSRVGLTCKNDRRWSEDGHMN